MLPCISQPALECGWSHVTRSGQQAVVDAKCHCRLTGSWLSPNCLSPDTAALDTEFPDGGNVRMELDIVRYAESLHWVEPTTSQGPSYP